MSLSFFKTDKSLESEGVWIPLPTGDGEIKIARIGNPEYKKLRSELERPYKKQIAVGGSIPEKKQTEILIDCFSKTILKDWRNIPDWRLENEDETKFVPFSVDVAAEALTDLEDFRNFVAEQALNLENYRAVKAEQAAKN